MFISGIVAWTISLALPTYKHGKVLNGMECLGYSILFAFFEPKNQDGRDLVLNCCVAAVSNLALLLGIPVFFFMRRSARKNVVALLLATILAVGHTYFLVLRRSEMESQLFGYDIWTLAFLLAGLGLCLTTRWRATKDAEQEKGVKQNKGTRNRFRN